MAGDSYTSDVKTIKVDKESLTRLQTEYTDLAADIEKRLNMYHWAEGSDISLAGPFKIRLGGNNFVAGQDLAKHLERIRTNLVERFTLTYQDSEGLSVGLKALLADTDAVEELNSMTSEQFGTFVQASTEGPDIPGAPAAEA
jgi:hypothetical protein